MKFRNEFAHLVEFVDTDDAAVAEDHRAGLQSSLVRLGVGRHRRRQTDAARSASSRRNRSRRRMNYITKQDKDATRSFIGCKVGFS